MVSQRSSTRPPTHPGALLRDIILPATGQTKTEIARLLGISRETLYRFLREDQGITPDLAARLGKLFGNGPAFWLSLQATHQAWLAEQIDTSAIPTISAA
jgi:addiction module HigA family antidote